MVANTFHTSHVPNHETYAAFKMHNIIGIQSVSIKRRQPIGSPWPSLHFRTHLYLFIVYTLLFAVVGVRRKLQTSTREGIISIMIITITILAQSRRLPEGIEDIR